MNRVWVAFGAALWLTGCAQVGPVQPPSPGLPSPVTNLTATRLGPQIEFSFTPAPGAAGYEVCFWPGRVAGTAPAAAATAATAASRPGAVVAAVPDDVPPPPPAPPDPRGVMSVPGGAAMPACPQLTPLTGQSLPTPPGSGPVTLAVAAMNAQGLTAGWSNLAVVPLGAVAPPPKLLEAVATPDGVGLRWSTPPPPSEVVEIFRQAAGQAPQLLASPPADADAYLDSNAATGKQFTYWLRSARHLDAELLESADSAHREVDTTDVFPPPVPQALQAVAAPGGGVDLSWNTVEALDLAGYNVYRRAAEGEWHKLNPAPLPTPVFHDSASAAGVEYAVTSVDTLGNESARSQPASAH